MIKNPHFWAIFFIVLVLVSIYSAWPWVESNPSGIGNMVSMHFLRDLGIFEFRYHMVCSLFIIPILYSTIIYSWRGAVVTWLIPFVIVLYKVTIFTTIFELLFVSLIFLFLPLLGALAFTIEINWRHKQKEMLAARETERETLRRASLLNIIEAQESERKYVAHNLHDDTIQCLLTITNRNESLLSENNNGLDLSVHLKWINNIIYETVDDLRRLCTHLRPSVLDKFGLVSALRFLIEKTNKESDIEFNIHVDGDEHKLPDKVEINIFRVIQEGLNNIRLHSNATHAILNINFKSELLEIIIEDNGQGFKISNEYKANDYNKFGLAGMQWRIESLGGIFQINSILGVKTIIKAEIYYDKCIKYTESPTSYRV